MSGYRNFNYYPPNSFPFTGSGPFNGHATLGNGLLAYWRMEDTTAAFGGFTLTNNNSVTFVAGFKNNAANFVQGSSQSLSSSNASLKLADSQYTVAGWANRGAALSREDYIIAIGNAPNSFQLSGASGGTSFHLLSIGDTKVATDATVCSAGTWYHVVGWHDSVADLIGITVNADTATTTPTGGPNVTPDIGPTMGARGAAFSTMLVDELGIWSRVLTAQERSDLYNGGAGLFF